MAKLVGINYNAPVQSLGRENVRGPLSVATAQANVAQTKVRVAGQIAGNMAAIGGIRQQMGRQIANAQVRDINRQREFASNMRRMVGAGARLSVDIIKSNAARSLSDYDRGEADDKLALQNSPTSFQQELDPNNPSLGTRSMDTSSAIMPQFQQMQAERKQAILANTNPLARPMVEQLIDDRQADSILEVKEFIIKRARDFTAAEGTELIASAVDREEFGLARKLVNQYASVNTPAKTAQYKIAINSAESEIEIEGKIYDAYQKIAGNSYTERNKKIAKVRNKDVHDGLLAMSDKQQNVENETRRLQKQRIQDDADQQWMIQIQSVDDGEMLVSDMTIPETDNPNTYKAMSLYRKNRAEGKSVINNPEAEDGMYEMARNNPDGFKQFDLNQMFNEIGKEELARLKTVQRSMLDGKESDELKLTGKVKASADRSLLSIGIDKKTEASTYSSLSRLAVREVEAFERDSGKKATQSQIDEIVDRTLKDTVTYEKGFFYGTNEQRIEIEDVSADIINPLADILRSRGIPVNSASLTEASKSYASSLDDIDAALRKSGQPVTLQNRIRMFEKSTR